MNVRVGIVVSAVVLAPAAARAGGGYIGDNGSQGMQRAGAFTAKADDPTALEHNPAALGVDGQREAFFGVNVMQWNNEFSRDGSYVEAGDGKADYAGDEFPSVRNQSPPIPIPFIAASVPLGERLTLGAGVFAPHGYGVRDYPETVHTESSQSAPAPQRYDVVSKTGFMMLPSIAASYRVVEGLRLGARASWGYASFESRRIAQGLPNDEEQPSFDAAATSTIEDKFFLAWSAGAHYRWRGLELGATYTAPMHIDAVGTVEQEVSDELSSSLPGVEIDELMPVPDELSRCSKGGRVNAVKTCLVTTLPQTATLGARWVFRDGAGRESGDIELDLRWEDWTAADNPVSVTDAMNPILNRPVNDIEIRYGFVDSYSIHLGGSRSLFRGNHRYEIRGGVAYDTETTPVSWSRVDIDGAPHVTVAGGLGIQLARWRIDVGAAYIAAPDRRVTDVPLPEGSRQADRQQPDVSAPLAAPNMQPYHPFNAGLYQSSYLVGSVGVTAAF